MFRHTDIPLTTAIAACCAAMALASCDSAIYDKEGDCEPRYALSFRFTKNVLNADAFGPQVTDIHVAVYDPDGKLILSQSEHRDPTVENDYRMPLDLQAGSYDIIAWCEGPAMTQGAVHFTLAGQEPGDDIFSSAAFFNPQGSQQTGYRFADDLVPLFYGRAVGITCNASDQGDITFPPIYLTKDTNVITVMLQNIGGQPLDPYMLDFAISAENSMLNSANSLTASEIEFQYLPWDKTALKATLTDGDSSDTPDGVKTEFTTSRLLADHEQRLTVTRKDTGDRIIDIPLIEYLLLVRSNYQQAQTEQDYLDMVDAYSLVFFIGDNYEWMKSRILINGWRVVPPQSGTITG